MSFPGWDLKCLTVFYNFFIQKFHGGGFLSTVHQRVGALIKIIDGGGVKF